VLPAAAAAPPRGSAGAVVIMTSRWDSRPNMLGILNAGYDNDDDNVAVPFSIARGRFTIKRGDARDYLSH